LRRSNICLFIIGYDLLILIRSSFILIILSVTKFSNCGKCFSHGFDGRSCLLKNICQGLQYARRKDGVIGKILKLLAEWVPEY